MVIRRIEPFSMAKVLGALYALLGLFFILIWWTVAGLFSNMMGTDMGLFSVMFGVGSLFIFPVLYSVFGFVLSLAVAFLYNLLADHIGGIEVEFE